MKRLTILSAGLFVLMTAFLFLSLTGLLPMTSARTVVFLNDQVPEQYNRLIMRNQDGLTAEYHFNKNVTHLIDNRMAYVQAEDARIVPRLEGGLPGRFFPQYISTLVLVVSDSADEIRSFADLREASCRLYITKNNRSRILPAMALALSGGENLNEAVSLLAQFQVEGRLIIGETSGEFESMMDGNTVALIPDDEAARLILSGLPLKMCVPCDGTYSFVVGLFTPSDQTVAINLDADELVKAGLRAMDGRSLPGLYPDAAEYTSAVMALEDAHYMHLAHGSVSAFRRGVMGTHLFSTANGSERVTLNIALAIMIVFWIVSLSWRIVDQPTRRLLQVQAGFLLLWLWILMLKQTSAVDTTRYLWYLYYLPLIGSATVLSLASLNFKDTVPERKQKIRPAILIPSGLLVLMVVTNDFHQFAFGFPAGLSQSEPYLHQPGFFLVVAWIAFLSLGGLVNLYRWAGSRKNVRFIMLLSFFIGIVILYNALYIVGVQPIRQTQMGTVHIVSILLLWELTLRGGLIPYNQYYRLLFDFSRLPLYLVRRDGDVCRHSTGTEPLPADVAAGIPDGKRLFFSPDDPGGALGADYEAAEISGGFVVWKNDLRGICRLNENLQRIQQSLLSQTALLEKQVEQEQAFQALSARRSLLEQLDELIRPRLDEIKTLSGRLSKSLSKAQFKTILRDIIDRIGYCKRAGLLHLSALPDGSVSARLLTLLLKEICSDFDMCGVETAPYGHFTGTLPLPNAILCLDFLRDLFFALRDCESGSIFVHADAPDEKLTISFLCDLPPEFIVILEAFSESKRPMLSKNGFNLHVIPEDPSLRLVLRKEGEFDA
ncbi:MAG: hypothetical protein NC238_10700 [Dehalobacter sp.]|nr:hypothetical protein [Dehalobacter sp.]